MIKDCDAHIRFSFITGVSKFSKVSLFSGLNNLTDITLDPRYSAICGYTEADLDTVFTPEMPGLDRDEIRDWYNGYGWRGQDRVYNPYDILLLFDSREFAAHWFETGTPKFLVDTLFTRRDQHPVARRRRGQRRTPVDFRRGRHADRGAAVPDRLPDDHAHRTTRGRDLLPIGLSEPGGAPEPQPQPAEPHDRRRIEAGDSQRATLRPPARQRLRWAPATVSLVLRQHSAPVVHEQRHRELRGLPR